jgi:hypothetical protein
MKNTDFEHKEIEESHIEKDIKNAKEILRKNES